MGIESSKVPTCMESKGVTNSKVTRGGSACKERDFLIRKAISWSGGDAFKVLCTENGGQTCGGAA
jgi:hypothetical protein